MFCSAIIPFVPPSEYQEAHNQNLLVVWEFGVTEKKLTE